MITKVCATCGLEKPVEDFYQQGNRIHPSCKKCENSKPRPRTVSKAVAQRARARATAVIIAENQDRYNELVLQFRAEAALEAERLAEAAPEHADGRGVVGLKPGRPMRGETVVDRIDVARCAQCARHHDRGHRCGVCGAEPGPHVVVVSDPEGRRRRVRGVEAATLRIAHEVSS